MTIFNLLFFMRTSFMECEEITYLKNTEMKKCKKWGQALISLINKLIRFRPYLYLKILDMNPVQQHRS